MSSLLSSQAVSVVMMSIFASNFSTMLDQRASFLYYSALIKKREFVELVVVNRIFSLGILESD